MDRLSGRQIFPIAETVRLVSNTDQLIVTVSTFPKKAAIVIQKHLK
jgi:hypothetical protein